MKINVDGKIMDLEKCEDCGAMKVVNKKCACKDKMCERQEAL